MAEPAPDPYASFQEHNTVRWLAVLDALELALDAADRLLADPSAAGMGGPGSPAARGVTVGGPLLAGASAPVAAGADVAGPGTRRARWVPPPGLGPLPDYLGGRVQRLIVRQRATAALLEAAKGATARHLAAVQAVGSRSGSTPAYVDVLG
ncbi:hypothetical protein GCM10011512_25670 [Tersicoccus solisilvae]|uniref:Uncharacterized protein n=1 Tax=Tersicoccus solisilvae TaxID=1882339 RepID=A0ABQ1PHT6_9MICC|nr:hypothetical protein [Tersicoccus solisilvae]GGC97558.1 hypothetical protein GCM10011512_25670 [Tersicoccus solisilvae]